MSLAVDASDFHVSAVLQQKIQCSCSPLTFFSKKLSATESNFSACDRELLTAYSSVSHFRFLPEGREFTLFTVHKSPMHTLFQSSLPWSTRQQHHLCLFPLASVSATSSP